MVDIVQALSDALNRDLAGLNNVAQNLANVNTIGYKSISPEETSRFQNQLVSSKLHQQQEINGLPNVASRIVNEDRINLAAGSLKQTNRSLDIAITGDAFFVVSGPFENSYTRNGSLEINQQGLLVNGLGMPIKGKNGDIFLDDAQQIRITNDGTIYQDENAVDQFEIVNFKQASAISTNGNSLLSSPDENLTEATNWLIHQGYIETSNVNSTQEMVRMMEISKHFESVQRALSIYDQTLTSGITKIGQ